MSEWKVRVYKCGQAGCDQMPDPQQEGPAGGTAGSEKLGVVA